MLERDTADWVEVLNARDVPAGAILTLRRAVGQPQVEHRNTFGTTSRGGDRRSPALQPDGEIFEDARRGDRRLRRGWESIRATSWEASGTRDEEIAESQKAKAV